MVYSKARQKKEKERAKNLRKNKNNMKERT